MDKKLASIYVLEADMQAANKDYNGAAANYEQAITFDPNCKEAYVKYARIYAPINSEVAAEVLNRLLAHDPSVGSRTPRAGRNLLQGRQTAQSR